MEPAKSEANESAEVKNKKRENARCQDIASGAPSETKVSRRFNDGNPVALSEFKFKWTFETNEAPKMKTAFQKNAKLVMMPRWLSI